TCELVDATNVNSAVELRTQFFLSIFGIVGPTRHSKFRIGNLNNGFCSHDPRKYGVPMSCFQRHIPGSCKHFMIKSHNNAAERRSRLRQPKWTAKLYVDLKMSENSAQTDRLIKMQACNGWENASPKCHYAVRLIADHLDRDHFGTIVVHEMHSVAYPFGFDRTITWNSAETLSYDILKQPNIVQDRAYLMSLEDFVTGPLCTRRQKRWVEINEKLNYPQYRERRNRFILESQPTEQMCTLIQVAEFQTQRVSMTVWSECSANDLISVNQSYELLNLNTFGTSDRCSKLRIVIQSGTSCCLKDGYVLTCRGDAEHVAVRHIVLPKRLYNYPENGSTSSRSLTVVCTSLILYLSTAIVPQLHEALYRCIIPVRDHRHYASHET
ncbi:hypothetical protein CLF_112644, partial [Clonorchis sinensis]